MKSTASKSSQSGFTLIEALIAMFILSFGLIGITNLIVVSTSANLSARQSTAAAFLATQQLETLKSTAFSALVDSNNDSLDVSQNLYNRTDVVPGVGTFLTRWRVNTVGTYGVGAASTMKFLAVRTEATGTWGRRSRAEFTSFRACTLPEANGCPPLS